MNLTKSVELDFTAEGTVISERSQAWCSALLCLFVLLLCPMLVSLPKVTIPHFLLLFVDQFKGPIRPGAFPTAHSVPVVTGRVCCVIACIHTSFFFRPYVLPTWPSWWPHNLFWMVLSERIDFIHNLTTCPRRGTTKSVPGTFLSQAAASQSDVCYSAMHCLGPAYWSRVKGTTGTNLVPKHSFLFQGHFRIVAVWC